MFTPIHLLPQATNTDRSKCSERWDTQQGRKSHQIILNLIKEGAGRHFLESDYQSGNLSILENENDLKGFKFYQQDITFPKADNFRGLDLSYSEFYDSKFTNATFFACIMSFSEFHNCTFIKCRFSSFNCYASSFEGIKFVDCDFIENNSFTNCSFARTTFQNVFIPSNIFYDCRFDSETLVSEFPRKPVNSNINISLVDSAIADIYKGFSQAYESAGVYTKSRKYLFLHSKYATRFNTASRREKYGGFFFEYVSGYGLLPHRVITSMVFWFLLALIVFFTKINFEDSLLLTCGALFTFGAKTDLLNSMGLFYKIIHIISSFVGISLTALFVTVLANVFMKSK